MEEFAKLIRAGVEEILFGWRSTLRSLRGDDPLSASDAEEIRALLKRLIGLIADSVQTGSYDVDEASSAARAYGQCSEQQEARPSDVIRELNLLQRCAVDYLASQRPEAEPAVVLEIKKRSDLLMDEVTATAIETFVESLFRAERMEDQVFHQLEGQFHLHRELELELQRSHRHCRSFAVMILSVDLAPAEARYGPAEMGEVLIDLMRLIRAKLRVTDRIFRYDRNDFILLCPETSPANVANLLARIQLDIDLYKRKNSLCLDVATGIATYPEDAKDSLSLIQVALADQSFRLGDVTC